MGVMRSRAWPGAYRSVRALAWWNLALSRTTAIFFPSAVSRWRRPRHEDGLLGVLVSLDGVDPHFPGRQARCPEERLARLLAVHVQPFPSSSGEPHASCLGLVLHTDLVDGVDLPALLEQVVDLVPGPGHPPGDGLLVAALVERVGAAEAHSQEAHEQQVRRSPTCTRLRT